MARWWELSPPTNVSWVRFPDPASYVCWVCCWFSTLLREVFRLLRFSPLRKQSTRTFQFLNEFLWTPWCSVGKQITFSFTIFTPAIVPWKSCLHVIREIAICLYKLHCRKKIEKVIVECINGVHKGLLTRCDWKPPETESNYTPYCVYPGSRFTEKH